MADIIDKSIEFNGDPLILLRPFVGSEGAAGLPPDSDKAPKVEGGNVAVWLAGARKWAVMLDEAELGLLDDGEELEAERRRRQSRQERTEEKPEAVWKQILNVCHAYLREYGKDIRVACYCLEAWIRRDGLQGLCNGLEMLRGLIAAYWEVLHPLPVSGDGPDRRLDCLSEYYASDDGAALEFTPLMLALNRYVMVAAEGANAHRLCDAIPTGVGRPDPAHIPEVVRRAAALTPPKTARNWLASCRRAIEECEALTRLADARSARDAIPFPAPVRLVRRVEEIAALLAGLYPAGEAASPARDEARAAEDPILNFPGLDRLVTQISGNRRSDNLRLLRALGRHFQDAEPHSPVGYALGHWAGMAELPLPKLLDAMGFVDNQERAGLQVFAGVKAPDKLEKK